MAEIVRLANSATETAPPPSFVMTATARNIHRSLKMMERIPGFRIGLICGAAGVGKTLALEAYLDEEPDGFKVDGAGGESDVKALSEDLCYRVGVRDWQNKSLTARRHALVQYLCQIKVLILDEAQHYNLSALEWIRATCEEAGCNLVFAGDEKLYAIAVCNPQIHSRAVLPRLFSGSSVDDIEALCKAYGLARDGIPKELQSTALNGGLRRVCNVIGIATIFADGGPIQLDHIRDAKVKFSMAGGE